MYGFGYDEELPGGYQEADLEMAELERVASTERTITDSDAEDGYVWTTAGRAFAGKALAEAWYEYFGGRKPRRREYDEANDERRVIWRMTLLDGTLYSYRYDNVTEYV